MEDYSEKLSQYENEMDIDLEEGEYPEGVESVDELDTDDPPETEGDNSELEEEVERQAAKIGEEK